MIATPTKEELVAFIQKSLKERAGITNFSESSVAGTLANTMAQWIYDIYQTLSDMDSRNSLSTAYGPYLDKIGDTFGVHRLPSKSATTVGGGRAVLFTNPTGVAIVVPAHTRVWSPSNYNLAYYTQDQITVPAADSAGVSGRAYADVTAAGSGEYYNVPPGALTAHNAGSQLLQVTNVRAISNGSELESDENYRYRIKNAILARQGDNETTLKMAILELPGVRDVIIRPLARGTGTVDVVIVPADRTVTPTLLSQAKAAALDAVSVGISVDVKGPIERPVDIELQIAVSPSADRTTARNVAIAAVQAYVDNIPVGDESGSGDLVISRIISAAQASSPDIRSVSVQRLKVDNKTATPVNQKALPGERFYLQSLKVV